MTKILIVEDEADLRENIVDVLELEEFEVFEACDGIDGIEKAVANRPDIIISDVSMPRLDGHGFFKKLHEEHADVADVPFLFLTAHSDRESELVGRDMGASDYLKKPLDFEILVARIKSQLVSQQKAQRSVSRQLEEMLNRNNSADKFLQKANGGHMLEDLVARYQSVLDSMHEPMLALGNINYAKMQFRTISEAKNIAMFLSQACPDPERAALGFVELLINAVEHGNLGLSYEDKSRLLKSNGWPEEIERRQALETYARRKAELVFERKVDQIAVRIIDEGDGFDFSKFMEIDPGRSGDLHGRGIAFANNISFSSVQYEGKGNEVVATINL